MKNIMTSLFTQRNYIRLAFLFAYASFSSWVPVFNFWLETNGLPGIHIGFVAAIPWLLILIVQPAWGILADKFGKKHYLKISLLGAVFMFFVFPLMPSFTWIIALATVLLSLFYSPALPLLDSIALDKVDDGVLKSYSTIRFWGAVGYALGASLTGWLIKYFTIDAAFYAASGFSVLLLVAASYIPESSVKTKDESGTFSNVGKLLTNRLLIVFLLIIVMVAIGQSAITFFLSNYMNQIGAPANITGIAIAMEGISELPFYFIAAWLLQRMAPGKIVLIAIMATALRLFLYSVNSNPHLVILIESMNGLTWTLLWVSSVEFVNSLIPAKWRTTGQSLLWAAYYGAGSVMGNLVCGWMYDQMAMAQIYYSLALMVLIIGLLSGTILFSKKYSNTI